MAIDHDQYGKTLVMTFFREYLELFFPDLAARLELSNPSLKVTFPNKEIYTDFPTGERRNLDVLAQVWSKEGPSETVLIVNENQEEDDPSGLDALDPKALARQLKNKERLPLAVRVLLYTSYLQQQHFPQPVVPIVQWFTPGKGGVGRDRYAYDMYGAGLSVSYYRVCIPDLLAEEYLHKDNPLAYGLAARMKRGKMSQAQRTFRCLEKIHQAKVTPMQRELLWTFTRTYATLTPTEEAEMQAILDEPENRQIKQQELSYVERIAYEGEQRGREQTLREAIVGLCEVLGVELTVERQTRLGGMDLGRLERLWAGLKSGRAWQE